MSARRLHPDASLRVLRKELLRLNDGRPELLEAMSDPRVPASVAREQLNQIDTEMHEILEAIAVLEEHWASKAGMARKGAA